MSRWLLQCEVEAHLGVNGGVLPFKHPAGRYEVHLENVEVTPGAERPILNAYVIFDSDQAIDAAADHGETLLEEFIDVLTLAAAAHFRIYRRVCLIDWSPDIKVRKAIIYRTFTDPNIPQLLLDQKLAQAVELLQVGNHHVNVVQSLHWFSLGVARGPTERMFQMFWLAIETLAMHTRDVTKVPTTCPKCKGPLWCDACQMTPMHRPFPTQAIRQLFVKYVKGDAERLASAVQTMRNALLHGNSLEQAEKETGQTLDRWTDALGRVAWTALLDVMGRAGAGVAGPLRIGVIQPVTFIHRQLVLTLHIEADWPDDRPLIFANLPKIDVTSTVTEDPRKPDETFMKSRLDETDRE